MIFYLENWLDGIYFNEFQIPTAMSLNHFIDEMKLNFVPQARNSTTLLTLELPCCKKQEKSPNQETGL